MGARSKRRRARKKGRAKRIARVQQVMADKAAEELRNEDMADEWRAKWPGGSGTMSGRMSVNKPNLQQNPKVQIP